MTLEINFCGERYDASRDTWLTIGRQADVDIDSNPYLHRRFLQVGFVDGFWWLVNVGDQLSATVADSGGLVQSWLAPGARLPIVFARTIVRFTAGPTSYEFEISTVDEVFSAPVRSADLPGEDTVGLTELTPDQTLLLVALAEPALRGQGSGPSSLPSSATAARRLGWSTVKLNKKVDNVCAKLSRAGVRGLHGGTGGLALNRRARLVEYALSVRLVTPDDLDLLDDQVPGGSA